MTCEQVLKLDMTRNKNKAVSVARLVISRHFCTLWSKWYDFLLNLFIDVLMCLGIIQSSEVV